MNIMKTANKTIYEIFDYFVGFAEVGIQLLSNNENNSIDKYNYYSNLNNNYNLNKTQNYYNICHKRIKLSMKKMDLYNPLNIIIDKIERDYAEYYKENIFKGIYDDIFIFIKNNKINDIKLFFIRLLYITPFFDIFDDQIKINKGIYNNVYSKECNINIINKKVNRMLIYLDVYIKELKKLYAFMYKKNYIIYIDFLNDK